MSKLTELKIKNLSELGKYSDGNGLFFRIKGSKSKNWLFRFTINGNTREIGLGTHPLISLKKARELANECRVDVANDIDPIKKRNEAKKKKCRREAMTFEMAAFERYKIKQQEWSNGKHQQQWINTLKTYVFPDIGSKPLFKIVPSDIEKCLGPIWLENKGWEGYSNWLCVRPKGHAKIFVGYDEAKSYTQKMGISSSSEWRNFLKSGKRPPNIPSKPDKTYKNKGGNHGASFLEKIIDF